MKIVAISDTHGQEEKIVLPEGDVLIHAGDFSGHCDTQTTAEFLAWFGRQPHPEKVLIAGNHDAICEQEPEIFRELLAPWKIHYLQDSGIKIGGLYFWGSPVQPEFMDWSFNRKRGADIKKHWDLIPTYTDVLITHGPPYGILDQAAAHLGSEHLGCVDLSAAVDRVWCDAHFFGHIHGGYGTNHIRGTKFFNCSQVNEAYKITNKPWVAEL